MRRRVLSVIGVAGLAALGLAYWFTYEPAPSIRVRWRDDVTSERQAALERKYLLVNGRAPAGRSIAYDLLDTRRANIKALVLDPDVLDMTDIDRDRFEVPYETPYGESWMWVADRIPLLRYAPVRWTLIVTLVVMVAAGRRRRARAMREGETPPRSS